MPPDATVVVARPDLGGVVALAGTPLIYSLRAHRADAALSLGRRHLDGTRHARRGHRLSGQPNRIWSMAWAAMASSLDIAWEYVDSVMLGSA